MLLTKLKKQVHQVTGKISLPVVLVIPFVLQTLTLVGITGWLSLHNGQKAVNQVASQLRQEISDRIKEHIDFYVKTPHIVNKINLQAIELKLLNIQDSMNLHQHFFRQMQVFESINYIQFGSENREFVGVERLQNGKINIDLSNSLTQYSFYTYETDNQGNPKQLINSSPNYDPRIRPWYKAPLKLGKPTWSPVYTYFATSTLAITATQPVYDTQGNLLGVLGVDLTLSQMNRFLQGLKIGQSGQTFILERTGEIIASSQLEPSLLTLKDNNKRLIGTESSHPLTQATSQYLVSHFGHFSQIQQQQLEFVFNQQKMFLQITPFREHGLDWLIIVVVPESDFMEEIYFNTYYTIIFCLIALILSIIVSIFTSQWIVQPIHRLSQAAVTLSQGKWEEKVEINRSDELGLLANSFNTMATQLQEYFATLEERIEHATAEKNQLIISLQKSQQKLSLLFQQTPLAIIEWDLDLEVVEWNPAAEKIFGYNRAEILGNCVSIFLLPPSAKAHVKQILQDLLVKHGGWSMKNENFTKEGERIICQWYNTPLIDTKGEIIGIASMVQNITEQQNALDELQASEERFRQLAENIHEGFWMSDPERQKMFYVSPAYAKLWEQTPEKIYQDLRILWQSIHPEDRKLVQASYSKILRGEYDEEYRIVRSDRSICWIRDRAFPVKNEEGKVYRIVGISEDITQRKLAEQFQQVAQSAQAASQAKSAFLANMSHELRTPLNAIIGYSDLLKEDLEDLGYNDLISDVDKIRIAGKHLLSLISDILDISKIEAGRMELYIEEFSPIAVIQEVASTIDPLLKKNANTLEVFYEENLGTMEADLTKTRQILLNLLSNAAKFTSEGIVTLRVWKEEAKTINSSSIKLENFIKESVIFSSNSPLENTVSSDHSTIIFQVKDTGIGMSAKQLKNLFQAFSQGDASTTRQYGGTGLGLAISRHFCQMMGGEIDVVSEPGLGSLFTVRLPINHTKLTGEN